MLKNRLIKWLKIKNKGWQLFYESSPSHVIPLGDTDDHIIDRHCWCKPEMEVLEDNTIMYKHRAFDGRD